MSTLLSNYIYISNIFCCFFIYWIFLCLFIEKCKLLLLIDSNINLTFANLYHDLCFNIYFSVQLSSVTQLCLTLCDTMECRTPGLPVHHQLLEVTQTHVRWVGDAIQQSHPLWSPAPPTFNLSQHQGLFKWVSSLHQVAKVLELQLQHQSFQWTPRTDLL